MVNTQQLCKELDKIKLDNGLQHDLYREPKNNPGNETTTMVFIHALTKIICDKKIKKYFRHVKTDVVSITDLVTFLRQVQDTGTRGATWNICRCK